jgi:hypothetical protein
LNNELYSKNFSELTAHAERIAQLESNGSLQGTQAHLLNLQYNDIAGDIDALKAKIEAFGLSIDRVEHDSARAVLAAEAQAHFDKIISDIKNAVTADDLENGRKIVATLDVWEPSN